MSKIKDITIKLPGNRFITTTVIVYSNHNDNEYTIPFEDNTGGSLDSEEREFIRDKIEAKIKGIRVDEEPDDYSDEPEDMEVYTEDSYT